jgi:hypothetical protein
MKLHRNIKIFINYFLGPLLFIWLSWSIYRQIVKQPDLAQAWERVKDSFSSAASLNLVAAFLLVFVNWSVEAVKWKISIAGVQNVSFLRSFRAVLSGVSFSVSTPNRIGEYLGRVLYMDEGNRLKTISLTIVGSISQLLITLLMGCAGWVILQPEIVDRGLISPLWANVILWGIIVVILVLTLFYFRLPWLVKWFNRIPAARRFTYLVNVLQEFNATILFKLLSLSGLRFGVFIIQYFLLFRLFGVDLSWPETLWTVSVSFLVMAVIPTITLLELVQRGKVVATVVGIYSANELGMNLATACIWFMNLVMPAIIGSLLILRLRKIITLKDETT